MKLFRPHVLALFALLAAPANAQTVHVVDPDGGAGSDFVDLEAALAAAADGDVVLLRAGEYTPGAGFFLDRSLTLAADEGAEAVLTGDLTVTGLDAGESVLLSGLTIDSPANSLTAALSIAFCDGPVTVVDCTVLGNTVSAFSNGDAVHVGSSASVTFVRGELRGRETFSLGGVSSAGLRVRGSSVSLYETDVVGGDGIAGSGDGGVPGRDGGNALQLFGSAPVSVLAVDASFLGGVGGDGGTGVFVPSLCVDAGDGGAAISSTASLGVVSLVQSAVVGGPGGTSPVAACSDGVAGPPTALTAGTVDVVGASARGLLHSRLVREGEPVERTATGPVGELVIIDYALDPAPAAYLPALAGAIHVDTPVLTRVLGIVGPGGSLAKPLTLGDVGLVGTGLVLHVQTFHIDLLALELFAAAPSPTIVLDSDL